MVNYMRNQCHELSTDDKEVPSHKRPSLARSYYKLEAFCLVWLVVGEVGPVGHCKSVHADERHQPCGRTFDRMDTHSDEWIGVCYRRDIPGPDME